MFLSGGFLLEPVFLRGLSAFCHLALLLALFASWACQRCFVRRRCNCLESRRGGHGCSLDSNLHRWCCLFLSMLNLVFCLLSYISWHEKYQRLNEKTATLLDFAARTIAWCTIYAYMQKYGPGKSKFSPMLRVWFIGFLCLFCYLAVADFYFLYRNDHKGPIWSSISDAMSVLWGLFLCHIGLSGNYDDGDGTKEPLLAGNSGVCESREGETHKPTSFSNSGIFSRLTFSWISPLIDIGSKKALDAEDVPCLDSVDSMVGALPEFKSKLQNQLDSSLANGLTPYRLAKALIMFAQKDIIITAMFMIITSVSSFVGPYLINNFVTYLNSEHSSARNGYFLISAFLVGKLVESISRNQMEFCLDRVTFKVQSLLVGVVYEKGLTVSSSSKKSHTNGEIINLLSIDAGRIGRMFGITVHGPWLVPLEISLALIILYKNVGLAAIASFVTSVLVMLLNIPLAKWLERYQDGLMESKDNRMNVTSELLRNMRILKLQAWDMKFSSKVRELRAAETSWLKKYIYTDVISGFVFWGCPIFISIATFGTCVLMEIPLESGKVLSTIATLGFLQLSLQNLPETVTGMINTKVSINRITSFLCLDDLPKEVTERVPASSAETVIEINNGNFSWDPSDASGPYLKDINLKVQQGMRVAVCGPVGSGKSSLLSCILGEVPKVSGTSRLCGTKAYVAQTPWIQSGTIEGNILFGKEMDRDRYDRVLEACSLKKDIEILPFGDQTVIGERGINLSGGQKQRIQIARALYRDADIYLFDDPFSAVDAHTGSHLFKVMRNGKIIQAGAYNDILRAGTDFMELVSAHRTALSGVSSGQAVEETEIPGGIDNSGTQMVSDDEKIQNIQTTESPEKAGQLVEDEEREKGHVGVAVYWKYLTTAYGGALVPIILLGQVMFQCLEILSDYWMAWASPVSADVKPAVQWSTVMLVYISLALGSWLCVLVRSVFLAIAGYKTATLLFEKMHRCIFRAPMSFFDSTPSGRILNRASTDQSSLDLEIPESLNYFSFMSIQLLGIIILMSLVAWQVFIIFIPIVAASWWYQKHYLASSRELSRLVGVCQAPIIQLFAETISGSTTIRSFEEESIFLETNKKLCDVYSRIKFHIAGAQEWLSFRLDLLSSVIFAFLLILLVSVPGSFISPAIAGVAVTYGLKLNTMISMTICTFCSMETSMISVERMLQYTDIVSEPPVVIKENRPESSWPSKGDIDICSLQVRYAPHMPLVLRGISCKFPGGTKTGIVGRTGCGKSTLVQTFFRIMDPAAGHIKIDGINICSIGVHDLRSRLSIIPQEPTMFAGSVRTNLDPLEEYTDEKIWEALDKCQLGDEVRKKEGKLDSTVTENGENWSLGQRQLICLGRVLLKKSRVLFLDEATASVDTSTDNIIQKTLREHFSDSTVVTIAHRISSVLDSDAVLLLDNGLIHEYDTPSRLLENKSSSFSQLVSKYTTRSNSMLKH